MSSVTVTETSATVSVTVTESLVTVQQAAAPSIVTAIVAGPQGPQGPTGPNAQSVKLDASLSGTWILANPLGRVPTVSVYLTTGEQVVADVQSTSSQITVTHAQPQQGYVVAF